MGHQSVLVLDEDPDTAVRAFVRHNFMTPLPRAWRSIDEAVFERCLHFEQPSSNSPEDVAAFFEVEAARIGDDGRWEVLCTDNPNNRVDSAYLYEDGLVLHSNHHGEARLGVYRQDGEDYERIPYHKVRNVEPDETVCADARLDEIDWEATAQVSVDEVKGRIAWLDKLRKEEGVELPLMKRWYAFGPDEKLPYFTESHDFYVDQVALYPLYADALVFNNQWWEPYTNEKLWWRDDPNPSMLEWRRELNKLVRQQECFVHVAFYGCHI